jgi:hypothetical protein
VRSGDFFWKKKGLSATTIQNHMSIFRVFVEWIGKKGMIRGSGCYIKESSSVERKGVAQPNKTWSGQKQSLDEKLSEIAQQDRHVAL